MQEYERDSGVKNRGVGNSDETHHPKETDAKFTNMRHSRVWRQHARQRERKKEGHRRRGKNPLCLCVCVCVRARTRIQRSLPTLYERDQKRKKSSKQDVTVNAKKKIPEGAIWT